MYLHVELTAAAHSSDHLAEQYIVHFISSQGLRFLPLLVSAASQLRMQRETNTALHTSEYLSTQAFLKKFASWPAGQDSQSEIRVEPALDMRGPSLPDCVFSGHLWNTSQPLQKSPGAHLMHSGRPRQDNSAWSAAKHGASLQVAQHL